MTQSWTYKVRFLPFPGNSAQALFCPLTSTIRRQPRISDVKVSQHTIVVYEKNTYKNTM